MSIMPAVAGVSVPVRLAIPDAEHKNIGKNLHLTQKNSELYQRMDGIWVNCRLTPHPYTMQWLQLELKPQNSWFTTLTITPLHVPQQTMAVTAIRGMFIIILVNIRWNRTDQIDDEARLFCGCIVKTNHWGITSLNFMQLVPGPRYLLLVH